MIRNWSKFEESQTESLSIKVDGKAHLFTHTVRAIFGYQLNDVVSNGMIFGLFGFYNK